MVYTVNTDKYIIPYMYIACKNNTIFNNNYRSQELYVIAQISLFDD